MPKSVFAILRMENNKSLKCARVAYLTLTCGRGLYYIGEEW
jgi:hypothetical protein